MRQLKNLSIAGRAVTGRAIKVATGIHRQTGERNAPIGGAGKGVQYGERLRLRRQGRQHKHHCGRHTHGDAANSNPRLP